MGYVFDFKDAKAYQQWYDDPKNGFALGMQRRMMLEMLDPGRGESILEIGCGTGATLLSLMERGLCATGIDPSPYMLDIAQKKLGCRVDLHRGYAEALPFEDNAFNHALFMGSLEYVEDPVKAIEEACRVAKDRVFIGVLNRYALKGIQRRVKGMFTQTLYNRASFFSVWELRDVLIRLLGDVPISWRTVCHLSEHPGVLLSRFESSWVVQRCPFGAFAGVSAVLVPRYITRPLSLKFPGKHSVKPVAG